MIFNETIFASYWLKIAKETTEDLKILVLINKAAVYKKTKFKKMSHP